MTTDLGSLLIEAVEDTERSLGVVDDVLAPVRRRVRRRRAVRHAVEGAGVLAVAAVLGVAAWSGVRHEPHPPAVPTPAPTALPTSVPTSGPSSEPTPDPTDHPSSDPTPDLTNGPAPTALGLPAAMTMPDGMLESARPGWALTVAAPGTVDQSSGTSALVNQAIDLLSPQGARYRAVDLPTDERYRLLRWIPGDTTAQLESSDGTVEVDLTDGSMRTLSSGVHRERTWVVGDTVLWFDDGKLRGATDGGAGRLIASGLDGLSSDLVGDPTGTRVALSSYDEKLVAVVDLVSGAREDRAFVVPSEHCSLLSWWDATNVVLLCGDLDPDGGDAAPLRHSRMYRLDVDSGKLVLQRELGDAVPTPYSGTWVRDGLVALTVSDGLVCTSAAMVWDGKDLTMLQPKAFDASTMHVTAAAGQVYVSEIDGCEGPILQTLTVHDLSSGTSTPLWSLPTEKAPPGTVWEENLGSLIVGGAS